VLRHRLLPVSYVGSEVALLQTALDQVATDSAEPEPVARYRAK
jgi:hypothetical protein